MSNVNSHTNISMGRFLDVVWYDFYRKIHAVTYLVVSSRIHVAGSVGNQSFWLSLSILILVHFSRAEDDIAMANYVRVKMVFSLMVFV